MAEEPTELPDDSPLREAAPTDELAKSVARSRIAKALFARAEPVKLGRYHLLEQVGSGGMGVVWGAWDPELDRRVAIKVVKPDLASARDRIVREGQALAKLSHPHVVPVHDVGVVGEQVYLVMEWVRGETLRAWTKQARAPGEIVRAYREAGMGLAAAHDAGLVHRDFKPENAMRGDDGRVRVLDFGLAREHGDADGGAGTPHYMAPEQVKGGDVTAAADQYALGIALGDALGEDRPKWLAAIIARATADAAADRFPSMHELVDALGRDPRRVRRRRLALAGAVALAGATFAIGAYVNESAEERCAGATDAIEWRDRTSVIARVVALGPYGEQVAQRAGGELDAYAKRWTAAQVGACRAHDRGDLTRELYTTELVCLTRARVALEAARDVLRAAPVERLPRALVAVQSLPAVERCRDEVTPLPAAIAERGAAIANDVARARVLALAVDPRAIDASAAAARAADALGYLPLVGRAALVQGVAYLLQLRRADASAAFARATSAALEANDNATAIEALARRLYAIASHNGQLPNTEQALAAIELGTPIAKGLDDAFVRALYYNNLGTLRLAREDRDGARAPLEEAQRVRPAPSRDTFELARIAGNLGLIETDRAKRDAFFDREGDELEAALGADHPLALDSRLTAAIFVENPQRSAALLADACVRYRRMHAHLAERSAQCVYELVWLAEERGELQSAADLIAAVATDPSSAQGRIGVAYRDLLAGKHADVTRAMRVEADALAASAHVWGRWQAVDARLLAAVAARELGDRAGAIADAERALAALEALGDFAKSTYVQRRRGRLLAMLALLGAGDVTARANAAIAWATLAGGYEERVAALVPLSGSSR